jgi:hypothetical protein
MNDPLLDIGLLAVYRRFLEEQTDLPADVIAEAVEAAVIALIMGGTRSPGETLH